MFGFLKHIDGIIEAASDACLHWLWREPGIAPIWVYRPLLIVWAGTSWITTSWPHHHPGGLIFPGVILGFAAGYQALSQEGDRLGSSQASNSWRLNLRSVGLARFIRLFSVFFAVLATLQQVFYEPVWFALLDNGSWLLYWWLWLALRPSGPRGKFRLPSLAPIHLLTPVPVRGS